MKDQFTLVIGASGATGKQLVTQLLAANQKVKVIVRTSSIIPEAWSKHPDVILIKCNEQINMSVNEMALHLKDCHAVASCLGHNMSWKGIYGKPQLLVTQMVQLICTAIIKNVPDQQMKLVLMNTAGNRNRMINEKISLAQQVVIGLLRLLLPPHVDNEKATAYLSETIGQTNSFIEWVVVRPDSLIDTEEVSQYVLFPSPIRSALFNAGQTSRINVAHFMTSLIIEDQLWQQWKGQMPIIYNETEVK